MFDEKEALEEQQPQTPGPQELFQEEATPSEEGITEEAHPLLSKKIIFIVLGIVFTLIIVALGVQFGLTIFQKKESPLPPYNSGVTPEKKETIDEKKPTGEQPTPPPPIVVPPSYDTDKDGLLDSEEETLGTSKENKDSDTDGLIDREEVRVYNTNPLNPDTDGDTYLDGEEVRNNFNPKGPGKLRVVQP